MKSVYPKLTTYVLLKKAVFIHNNRSKIMTNQALGTFSGLIVSNMVTLLTVQKDSIFLLMVLLSSVVCSPGLGIDQVNFIVNC